MKQERGIFAVCDLEVEYAYHFMEYLSKKRNIPFEMRVFTSADTLLKFVKGCPIELLLISEEAMCEEIQEEKIGQIMILSEGIKKTKYEQYPSIYKYQSSNQVLREAMNCYGQTTIDRSNKLSHEKRIVEIVGIYSPVSRTMKTTFALTLGQILAKKKSVLYINLEEYSGFEYLLEHTYDKTLADLLYFVRQKDSNIILKMQGMIQTMNNLDFIPPVLASSILYETLLEDWKLLLQEIIDYSNYETVILDFGDGLPQLFQLLELCTKIYMPIRTDPMSRAKIRQFEEVLRIWDKQQIEEKIQKIKLPFHRTIHRGSGYLDDLVWSELGDFVRELIRVGKGGNLEWKENSLENFDENY